MLTWLRRSYPEAKIGWAIDEELAPAIEGHPCLDYIHPIPRKRWSRSLKNPAAWLGISREFGDYVGSIKSVDYDVAIDTQSLFKTALTAYCAGIRRRVGYAHNREMSGLFLNEKYLTLQEYFEPTAFHMDHLARLAKEAGCTNLDYDIEAPKVPPEVEAKIATMVQSGFADTRPIIAIAPGTQWISKHWPDEYWVGLISTILSATDLNVMLVGSKGDAPLCARILQAFPSKTLSGRVLDVSGKTNIPEMYALYKHVSAAIGADSAPQHVAGAVKTPCVIAIFGPTAHRRTAPFGSQVVKLLSTEGTLPCQPCHKKICPLGTTECMTRITPESVFAELLDGLRQCEIRYASKTHRNESTPVG